MTRRRQRQPVKLSAFQRAKWFLRNGYSFAYVAEKLGVHRNTVRAWARKLDRHPATVNRLVRHIMRLPGHQRAEVVARLNKKVTNG